MCRKLIYFFSFVLVLNLVGMVSAQDPDILLRSPDKAMPVIDAVVDDVWSLATEQDIPITTSGSDPSGPSDCSGVWRVLWDWEHIYALVIVKDEALNNDSGAGAKWNDDSVEFYVDGDNSKGGTVDENDHQYTCRWNNAEVETPSAIHNGDPSLVGFEYAIVTTGSGYIYEARIPWTSIMTDAPVPGQLIGIDMYINDDDDGTDRDTQIAWYSTEGAGWNTPSFWGTAQLVAGNRAGIPSPANGSMLEDTWANLGWQPGPTAVSHDVYFGENIDDVDAGVESTFQGNLTTTFLVVGFPGFAVPDGLVPGTTYYWRVDAIDVEGTVYKGDVWSFMVPPKTAYFPVPADAAGSVAPDVELSWTGGFGAKLHTIYFGDNFDDVSNATGGSAQGTLKYTPGTLKFAKTYYWRVDEFDVVETHKGSVWSFTTEGAVESLDPVNGAVDVTQTPILSWSPGVNGASHEVYFGADAASLELKGSGNLGSESFEPGQLEWNTTYYWRVDEANNADADSPWTGPLWSFTTANFLIIDDMESYNDIDDGEPGSNRIYNAWVDGYDDPTNGSQTGHLDAPFYEESIVHSGNKSMPLYYDNAVGKSESTLTLTSNRDWTVKGVDTLTIWYIGGSSNAAETMYVTLNGSASVDNDNPDAAQAFTWTEWNIPLQAFADQGVNLGNVTSITLGLRSVTGGTGMLYFDDICLYPPALPAPSDTNLMGWWKLDEGEGTIAVDSSGHDNNGSLNGIAMSWMPGDGMIGGALSIDGAASIADYVEISTADISTTAGTVAMWGKLGPDQQLPDIRYFCGHTTIPAYGNRIQLYMDNADTVLDLGLGDSHARHQDIMSLTTETWYHVALTWDGGNYAVYVNGEEKANGNYTGLDTLNTVADIGNDGNTDGRTEAFNGLLDDVRIYNVALTGAEISYLAGAN